MAKISSIFSDKIYFKKINCIYLYLKYINGGFFTENMAPV